MVVTRRIVGTEVHDGCDEYVVHYSELVVVACSGSHNHPCHIGCSSVCWTSLLQSSSKHLGDMVTGQSVPFSLRDRKVDIYVCRGFLSLEDTPDPLQTHNLSRCPVRGLGC